MRTNHCTITGCDSQIYAEMLLQKHLRLKDHGPKCRASRLWTNLLYAAALAVRGHCLGAAQRVGVVSLGASVGASRQ